MAEHRKALTPDERAALARKIGPAYAAMLELERAAFYHRSTRPAFDALLESVAALRTDRERALHDLRSERAKRARPVEAPDYVAMAMRALEVITGQSCREWKAGGVEHRAVNTVLAAWAEQRKARQAA